MNISLHHIRNLKNKMIVQSIKVVNSFSKREYNNNLEIF